ncbi:hypothetical protein NVP2275O_290 [Vibrio phage 2.275.O._10N.286.54.E11]|nr:hypothetical protein NVP2275O_290 [Vibrio phage 2.275.O._10N.286.54.E11]
MKLETDADFEYYNYCQAVSTLIVHHKDSLDFASKNRPDTSLELELALSLEPHKYTKEEWWDVLNNNIVMFALLDERISKIIPNYIKWARE